MALAFSSLYQLKDHHALYIEISVEEMQCKMLSFLIFVHFMAVTSWRVCTPSKALFEFPPLISAKFGVRVCLCWTMMLSQLTGFHLYSFVCFSVSLFWCECEPFFLLTEIVKNTKEHELFKYNFGKQGV